MEVNTIYLMDCMEGMRTLINERSVDIIVTSPPYNIGVQYNSYEDNMPHEDYLNWMEAFGRICHRVLKEDGSLFLNLGAKVSDPFRAFEVGQRIAKSFELQNMIHWIKSIAVPEHNINIGNYKPVNSPRFLNNLHEYIFHFTKHKSVPLKKTSIGIPYADKANMARWQHGAKNGGLRDRGNVWFIPYETVCKRKEHPASFPPKLPEMCIKLHGFDSDTLVLDPFSGSGTTCLAAKRLGCRYLGFETDKEYFRMATEKLQQVLSLRISPPHNDSPELSA